MLFYFQPLSACLLDICLPDMNVSICDKMSEVRLYGMGHKEMFWGEYYCTGALGAGKEGMKKVCSVFWEGWMVL